MPATTVQQQQHQQHFKTKQWAGDWWIKVFNEAHQLLVISIKREGNRGRELG